ncbi:MAG: hypothetical protein C5B43_04120 [Verrucomicrobia bacterium]|nr:MAG: hypothetical protein C5B43_04120 [Verrucomicrobiota bacterium]
MITFEDFTNLLNGTSVDFDNYFGDQCVDLVQFWSRNLGGPRFTGDAQDLANQAGTFYTWVANTPDAVPQKGDIIVWSKQLNNTVGHVAIASGTGDTNSFQAFEQNDPGPGVCLFKTYSYFAVLGWLHPASIPVNVQDQLDAMRSQRDTNWTLYQQEIQKTQDANNQLSALQLSFEEYKKQHPETEVTSTPEIPVPTTTSSGTTTIPIVVTSTSQGESATSVGTENSTATPTQPLPNPEPIKPSLPIGDRIVFFFLSIINALKRISKGR